jgi:hypothetical protein
VIPRRLPGKPTLQGLRVSVNSRSLADRDATDDIAAQVRSGATGSLEDPAAKPRADVQHAEEDVLRLDGAGPELADRGASVDEDLECSAYALRFYT